MFLYWLLSGFTFFLKKYNFGKFTSIIQRFWKRSFLLFWLIEGSIFLTFFYLTINASEEVFYFFDNIKLLKFHLFSWKIFFLKIFLNIFLIIFLYFFILVLNWSLYKKNFSFLILITFFLLYLLWQELYQFFHIINFYGSFFWYFDIDSNLWTLEIEYKRTRLANNFLTICLLAKFWHFIFIFIFWIFFFLRTNENLRIRYTFISANYQNFIILYIMSWLYMYPWLKFLLRNFVDFNYSSLFLNMNKNNFRMIFNEIKLYIFTFLNNTFFFISFNFNKFNFFYIFENSYSSISSFKKFFFKNLIVEIL